MKSDLGGLISRLDTTEERISEFENMSIKTSQTEKQRGKKSNTVSKRCGTITKGLIYI